MRKGHLARAARAALLALLAAACTDTTDTLGVYPDTDELSNTSATFGVTTRSRLMENVAAGSTTSCLGRITDPETGTEVTADFAAQFQTAENYRFPPRERLGDRLCDSVDIRLFIASAFGEKNNPMKLEVYPLDPDNVMSEESVYLTSTDLWQYVTPGARPVATKVFTATDYSLAQADRESATHTPNVRLTLPREYGERLMRAYYDHPEHFRDSHAFIRNVCPGFYFKIKSGTGTMLTLEVATLNVSFHYTEPSSRDSSAAPDTVAALARFAATPEVIQCTRFGDEDFSALVDDPGCTYLKTPAAVCTEVTLPVRDIYRGHETDSVSKAQLTLPRLNNTSGAWGQALSLPPSVLLVRKADAEAFFRTRRLPDSRTSYTASLDRIFNAYTFENVARLISYCQHEKRDGMRLTGQSEAEWEAAHPDWDKALVIPVKISASTNSAGESVLVGVAHDMEMHSTRLARGTEEAPLKMQVIYSTFHK